MNPFDVATFAANLPAKLEKDERRIKLFLVATQAKAVSLQNTPLKAAEFAKGAAEIAWKFVSAGNPKKWSLGSLFGKDPWAKARDDARTFAKKWDMDPVLIKELG